MHVSKHKLGRSGLYQPSHLLAHSLTWTCLRVPESIMGNKCEPACTCASDFSTSLLQASCRALLVTHNHLQHDTAAIRLNLGALAGPLVSPSYPSTVSYDPATLEKLTPWIVTSPPRPTRPLHQHPSQPSLLQHQSDQPFVAFSYKRPARKTQEPTVLQLTIAPIDVIYSQLCLLSLLDFLNAALPTAGLDPLKVRASVSLREIVQEKLQGQQQRQMARRQQQHNMQRTKVHSSSSSSC